MSGELPEDLDQWPEDPFTLLGVTRGAEESTIRRAYTRLIRRFKPEHFPEHFRRLRDAYETCRYQTNWYIAEPAAHPTQSNLPPLDPVAAAPATDEVQALWSRAVAGQLDEAYSGLKLLARSGNRGDACLPLYWLLALHPGLDSTMTRHEWLFETLIYNNLFGPAVELYRRELELDPQLALEDPYSGLLKSPAAPANAITLACHRLRAAAEIERLDHTFADLRQIKPQLKGSYDSQWLNLIIQTSFWAEFDHHRKMMNFCSQELASLRHLELSHTFHYDRLEEARHWRWRASTAKRTGLPREFLRMVFGGWVSYTLNVRELCRGLEPLVAQPMYFLARIDELRGTHDGEIFMLAESILERHLRTDEDEFPDDTIRRLARIWHKIHKPNHRHSEWRISLLRWLIEDQIRPVEFVRACEVDPDEQFRRFADKIREDIGFRLIWLALYLRSQL